MNTMLIQEPRAEGKSVRAVFGGIEIPGDLSYPDRYQVLVDIAEVGAILVRPLSREDIVLYDALFQSLTPRSIYLRYFCYVKQLSPTMLEQWADVDHHSEIALVALIPKKDQDVMIADARVIRTERKNCAEFSILVADHWHGKGIGACLLAHCLDIARQRDIKEIFGMVLAENIQMLALGRKMGFTVSYCPSTREYELTKIFDDEE